MSRYALITGASSGIGLALAEALARRGRNLILVARQRDALESIACELTQRFSVEVLFRACDLSQPLRLSGLLHELEESALHIDLLVNNAGIGTAGAYVTQDWASERQLIELNVLALARLCHAIGTVMAGQGSGQILNVASVAGFQPGPGMSNYYASKAYVLHFSEGLREELKAYGVGVSVLCPGPTRSGFFRRANMDVNALQGSKLMMSAEEVAKRIVDGIRTRKRTLIMTRQGKLAVWVNKLFPAFADKKVYALFAKEKNPLVR